jgi:3-methyladenine DNA glycosylase/8-oxoguanine DNA glycosylase
MGEAATIDQALRLLARRDPALGRLIRRYGPFRVQASADLFCGIAESIVAQQLSWAAAKTIISRLRTLYPGRVFPSPEDVVATPPEALRSVGLSRAKAASLLDLAGKILDGTVDLGRLPTMSDEEVISHLVRVRGIGRWTAEMVLIFDLGRLDVLPVDDLGVKKGFQKVYGLPKLPTAAQMIEKADQWRPFRSIGTWYMWKAVDQPAETLV